MKELGAMLEKAGTALAIMGGLCLAGIFLVVLVHGTWPGFLRPVRDLFRTIYGLAGSFGFVIELALFVGPGFLIAALGQKLQDSN